MAKRKTRATPERTSAHKAPGLTLDERVALYHERVALYEKEQQYLRQRYSFGDAMSALRHDADPMPLMWHLRSGKPIPPEHAEQLADLLDPKASYPPVVAKIEFRKKGQQRKDRQQRAIYDAVMHLRGNNWKNPMPPGAWDQVVEHFKLGRKTVETAYYKERAEIEEYMALPDLEDEETAAALRAEGWVWDTGEDPT